MHPTRIVVEVQDVRTMGELVQRTWSFERQWHIGDVAWSRCQWLDRDDWPTALWLDVDGRANAWAWIEQPERLNIVVDPERVELVDDVLGWFEEVADGPALSVTVLEHETHLIRCLELRGYERGDGPFFLHMARKLSDIPEVEPPDRFVVRPITPTDLPERVRVHRSAWEPSSVTEASYQRLTECWPYRGDLDWVAELDGTFASFCLAWLDELHEVGELEPVGTDPRFRHMGLGRAACLGAMQALRELGAHTAIVYARGDEAYPIPAEMYRGLGFEAYARTWTYRRSRL